MQLNFLNKAVSRIESELRCAVSNAGRELGNRHMNTGSSGNVSCLLEDGKILITATGTSCESIREESLVVIDFEGRAQGSGIPSCEWQMHVKIYRHKPEARAIIHTHSDACVALSCLRRPIPAFHYLVAAFGGNDVPCAAYAPFGSRDLADSVAMALRSRRACLLANHGMVCHGKTLREALQAAIELESLARQYLMALQVGEPVLLSDIDMSMVQQNFEA